MLCSEVASSGLLKETCSQLRLLQLLSLGWAVAIARQDSQGPHRLQRGGLSSPPQTQAHHDEDKKNPSTRAWLRGSSSSTTRPAECFWAHLQELGSDLALLPNFRGFLAALLTFTMWAMHQTLNEEVPKYPDQIPSP